MYENLSVDTDEQPDELPKKKSKAYRPLLYSHTRNLPRREELSPNALRRKYLPRNPTRRKPPAPHTAAAAAAAGAQVQPPETYIRNETTTKHAETTHRHVKLTRFQPGHEWETECQVAQAFKRPPRLFKEDKPFYPWLPRPEPLVNFHLNFKF